MNKRSVAVMLGAALTMAACGSSSSSSTAPSVPNPLRFHTSATFNFTGGGAVDASGSCAEDPTTGEGDVNAVVTLSRAQSDLPTYQEQLTITARFYTAGEQLEQLQNSDGTTSPSVTYSFYLDQTTTADESFHSKGLLPSPPQSCGVSISSP